MDYTELSKQRVPIVNDDLSSAWNKRYINTSGTPEPAEVLAENSHLLPDCGDALDIASGAGNNALFLAACGLKTSAWDISSVAIDKLLTFSRKQNLTIDAQVRDVAVNPPKTETFDVITVSRFLIRDLAPVLTAALRPGGLLFYQTFTAAKVNQSGPSNPDYLLLQNELLHLFSGLVLRIYREEGQLGATDKGFRNAAMLVAEKPH